jgi:hypothetical protein
MLARGHMPTASAYVPRPEGARDYDLLPEVTRSKHGRVLGLLIGALGAVVLGYVGYLLVQPSNAPNWNDWGLAGLLWVGAGVIAVVAVIGGPAPPRALRLTSEGVTLLYPSGAEYTQRWDDPRFGLMLKDYKDDENSTAWERDHIFLAAPSRHSGYVPRQVSEATIAAAKEHSMPISEGVEVDGVKVAHQTWTTRIGKLEATPGFVRPPPPQAGGLEKSQL